MKDPKDIKSSTISSRPIKQSFSLTIKPFAVIKVLILILLLLLSFWAGSYFKDHNSDHQQSSYKNGLKMNKKAARSIGIISNITPSSITIRVSSSGALKTYGVNSKTKVIKNKQLTSFSTLIKGIRIVIIPSKLKTSIAAKIIIAHKNLATSG